MKLIAFLFLFNMSITHAKSACNEGEAPLPGNQELYSGVDDLLNHIEAEENEGVTYKNCENNERDLRLGVVHAGRMADYLMNKISTYRATDPGVAENLNRIYGKIECAARKLKSAKISCKDLGGDLGKATPLIGTGISIDPQAHHDEINTPAKKAALKDTAYGLEYVYGETILHEMTHKCGTNDKAYFAYWNDDLLGAGPVWGNVADMISNWGLWGFCIPGAECKNRKAPLRGQQFPFER